MEKMGCSITQYLLSYPKLRVEVATRIGMLLLRKLKTLHQAGYLHLDIKPSNLIFTPDYSDIMLIDFGFATPIRHPTHDPSYFRGSIHYSSLNRMKGGEYSFIDDIESLLYVIYRMITGKLPWTVECSQ
jgi:serine/threonine protein kinase